MPVLRFAGCLAGLIVPVCVAGVAPWLCALCALCVAVGVSVRCACGAPCCAVCAHGGCALLCCVCGFINKNKGLQCFLIVNYGKKLDKNTVCCEKTTG